MKVILGLKGLTSQLPSKLQNGQKLIMVKACKTYGVNATGYEHDLLDLILRMELRRQKQIDKQELDQHRPGKEKKNRGEGRGKD